MNNEDTVKTLNNLLTKAYDAEQGYEKAAERAEGHPNLVTFFKTQSDMRLSFGKEIKGAITRYGGEPDKGASIPAKAHQVWITVKTALSGDDNAEAVLEECIRGEEAALSDYDEALKEHTLPIDVRDLITAQRSQIAESVSVIKIKEKLAD